MENGQSERSPAAAAAAAPSSVSASARGGDGRGLSEREDVDWQRISDMPGLLSIVMAFLPLHLLVRVSNQTWQQAAPSHHRLVISAEDREERSVWQRMPLPFVNQLAALLTQLTCVVPCYPIGFPLWCFDVFVAMVEGHIAARRAANMEGGTLHTISIEGVHLTEKERETVTRTPSPLPPPLDTPPALPALTTIVGLMRDHQGLADRGWRVPSLAVVRQAGWEADNLGRFISSSISLQHVDGGFGGGEWARVLKHIPETTAGQLGGPPSHLEAIGTIDLGPQDPAVVERLREVLLARGSRRSLEQLHVHLPYDIGRPTVPVLLALDRLVTTCCQHDAPVTFESPDGVFDLDIFYHNDLPTYPSPPLECMIQELARQATVVRYTITADDFTDDDGGPTQSAIDIAKTLTFDKTKRVEVLNAYSFRPPAKRPPPHPSIITHLQPFPKATSLDVHSTSGVAAGRLLGDKMVVDKVAGVLVSGLPGGEKKVGVLTALGREREVGDVWMGEFKVDELVGATDRLPSIKNLHLTLTLPSGCVEDAGSFVYAGLSSLIDRVRGLQRLGLRASNMTPQQRGTILASLPEGAKIDGFTLTHKQDPHWNWTTVTALRDG
ncbi:unnamed protein product [Vitrella brassicaformis CCMP3155]|uniref:Uncharacterized protein n=1 Tax=Vitrella brassicaformis (strain CCMP3155) TaxID=1169540 RepID=A0A0G4H2X9_VITBC|nr:unnamed protein product [Vitrella brassicaformis CCMP3155]|eukprot:CEM38049.1 unnamed protein product [Vitrella brassicaformis CCMP3155]